ncbi:ribonuclease D [Motilimonas pumila]|uniref:Ribonuclease D n=1 Tax=Motilimonas pumila TaxID=2303987 RepID=A0A418YDA2_9GAMM|nr:ribonuclease D [Motilimonas pumila]RJG42519.1 ribonuclease D [Motilimonas pumila]
MSFLRPTWARSFVVYSGKKKWLNLATSLRVEQLKFKYISTQDALMTLNNAMSDNIIALDTEFVRTRTYYANLGLLQFAQDQEYYLIDPLAVGDLAPFWQALESRTTLWHSFAEDLEIVKNHKGDLNGEHLDTQIACGFLNMGHSLGYAAMVNNLLGVKLDKGEARTDWLARPLADRQLDYAIRDVVYLEPCYDILAEQLNKKGLLQMFKQECHNQVNKRLQQPEEDQLYVDIKNAAKLNQRGLAVLQALAKWRFNTAKTRNYALNFVVKEAHLWEVAKHQPKSKSTLSQLGLTEQEIRVHGDTIITLVKQAMALAPDQLPAKIKPVIEYAGYKAEFKRIKEAVALAAQQNDIAVELLASKKTIHQYLGWLWKLSDAEKADAERPMLLSDWRYEMLSPIIKLG